MEKNKISWSAIQKASPQENAIVERFNRTYREDVLDANLFANVSNAQEITDRWRHEYNYVREHESLGYKTPVSYAA